MFRVRYSNTMCFSRIYINFCYDFQSLKDRRPLKIVPFPTTVSFSTVYKHKVFIKTSASRQKAKLKLKPKPYEELLKVLELRERDLEEHVSARTIKRKPPNHSNEFDEKKICRIFKQQKIDIESSDGSSITSNEGIYSVKTSTNKKNVLNAKKSKKLSGTEKEKKKEQKLKSEKAKVQPKKKLPLEKEELERITKNMYASRTLKAYIQVCINANEVEKAQQALEYYNQKNKFKTGAEIYHDVELYNLLISGWAHKGQLDKVKHLFLLMTNNNVSPNLQSYAGYLESISRSKFFDLSEVEFVLNEMKSSGFSSQDLLDKCIFTRDQREKIIEVLGFVETNLTFPSYKCGEAYTCKLLEKLNDKLYEVGNVHLDFCFKENDIQRLASRQMEMENNYSLKIKSVATVVDASDKVLKSRKYLKECEDIWRKKLTFALKNIKHLEKKSYGFHRPSIYPYLAVIKTDILVDLLIKEIRFLAETGEFFSPNVKVLHKELGIKVMNHYFIWLNKRNEITDKVFLIYQKYMQYLLQPQLLLKYSPREYWEYLKTEYSSGPTIDISHYMWPQSVLTYIGKYLYDILQSNVAFNANAVRHKSPSKVLSQAFYTTYESLDVKLSKQIRTHTLLCKLYRDAQLDYLEFDVSLVPMLSPPHPWVKHDSGGLLITKTPFVRFPEHAHHQTEYYSKVPSHHLNPCFDSLNYLSLCPWIINKPMLDLVIDVFSKGGSEELDIPLNPNALPSAPKIHSSMSKKEKAIIRKQKMELKKNKCEITSLWFDCLYKLSIANHFREDIFWFPHNLDFRGRVYPTPPHFNHLRSYMARTILLFAKGQPLGPKGLDWLKVHLINLTGFKKRDPHCERLSFANEMMPEILDSADHPFEGNQWWKTSDKPWQTLACCKEVANAVRHPRPEEYVSHFPVHQDGSCNGLQHYAALGRDELGAIEVNLHPSATPQDVYSGVAALVEKERQKDAADGIEIAKYLEGFVKRKVVKQTVMTFVYGVTTYGAKLQILKQLKAIPEFPEKYYHEGAIYLMKKTFLSIKEMFTATKQIQDWLTDCAEQITKVSGDTLEWITPLGFPVIQPYHKEVPIRGSKYCISQGKEPYFMSKFEPYQLPNIRKQKNAFAPNFIHSLDSSHMMLTSLFCQRKGITFVSVHDCYWTHSATVEIMNKVCREQFVALHKEPILENLSAFFLEKYARVADRNIQKNKACEKTVHIKLKDVVTRIPEKGAFDLNKVLDSIYFFS